MYWGGFYCYPYPKIDTYRFLPKDIPYPICKKIGL